MSDKKFTSVVARSAAGVVYVAVPFDPDEVWGRRSRHLVAGLVDHHKIRGSIARCGEGFGVAMGPAWLRDTGVNVGDTVSVALAPEGPQRAALAPDLAAALAKEPDAAAFFDGLAQFYRKNYLNWIDATKKRPDERVRRIADVVTLLKAGIKTRPK